jgi:hypothetical protein
VSAFRTRAAVAGALLAPLAACATPGNTPSGTPSTRSVTLYASVGPAQPQLLPVPLPVERVPVDDVASCAWSAAPMPAPSGSTASLPASSAAERARRALAAQASPAPTRGAVPPAALPGAQACVRQLRMTFRLLTAGSGQPPDDTAVRTALQTAGLQQVRVQPGPAFAGSTGQACVIGAFAADSPTFTIAAPAPDGTCNL